MDESTPRESYRVADYVTDVDERTITGDGRVVRRTWIGEAPPLQQVGEAAAAEIRIDFAQRLIRRFEAMAASWGNVVEASEGRVHETAPDHWDQAARIVQLMLDECNGEEDNRGAE